MTVQYYHEVLTVGPATFLKLLKRWRGSVFKLIYKDAIIFTLLYIIVSCLHRFVLTGAHKNKFEQLVIYVGALQSSKPIALVLGFYVGIVFKRFWIHFNTVPWITKIAMLISTHLNAGSGEGEISEVQLQKRGIIRYLVAAQIITLSRVSVPVRRRFPNLIDLYHKGILMEHEVTKIMETQPLTLQPFLPIAWCTSIIMKAYDQGRIINDPLLINMIKEIDKFRHGLQELFLLDHICVPLVYTQVVTVAVYSYFLSSTISRQFPSKDTTNKDFVVPIATIIKFIVYVGWLKLALTLVNPMGEDDEDFDLNTVVDYNFEVGMAIVSQSDDNQPSLSKDIFFNDVEFTLPMEITMREAKSIPFMGSIYNLKVDEENWVTSLQSIVTTNGDVIDRNVLNYTSMSHIHTIEAPIEDYHMKVPSRSGSSKSSHRHHPIRRQVSTTSSFVSNVIEPITEEDNGDSNDNGLNSNPSETFTNSGMLSHFAPDDHDHDMDTVMEMRDDDLCDAIEYSDTSTKL